MKKTSPPRNRLGVNLEKALTIIIRAGIFLILLTPFIIDGASIFPTVFPKAIYFRSLVEIIFGAYLILAVFSPAWRPRFSFLSLSLLFFVEVLILSSWRGINFYRSFWGTIERMEGLIIYLHLFAFYLVLAGVCRKAEDWLKLLRFIVGAGLFAALAGIIQKLGLYSFHANPDALKGGILGPLVYGRISGTFGNPIFFANYLVLVIILAVFLAHREVEKRKRAICLAIAGLCSFVLLMTGSRGAWFGLFCAGIVYLVYWLFSAAKTSPKRHLFLYSSAAVLFLCLIFVWLSVTGRISETAIWIRYLSIYSFLFDADNSSRVMVWQMSLKALKDSPIFGFGQESFSYIFSKYYQAKFIPAIPENEFFDRAHNKVMDLLVTSGIIGLISYLSIFIVVIYALIKKRATISGFMVLISFFVAYFAENLFSFDTIYSHILFIIVLALISHLSAAGKDSPSESFPKLTPLKLVFSAVIIIAALIVIYRVNLLPFRASRQLRQGQVQLGKKNFSEAMKSFNSSLSFNGFSYVENCFYSGTLIYDYAGFVGSQEKQDSESGKLVWPEMEKAALRLMSSVDGRSETKVVQSYFLAAQIYRRLYFAYRDQRFLDEEEKILAKVIEFNPQTIKAYRLAGEARFLRGKDEEGLIFLNKAYNLDKNAAAFYEWLGTSLLESGQGEKGAANLRKSMRLGVFYTPAGFSMKIVWNVAMVYEKTQNYSELAKYYGEVLYLYPKELAPDPQLYASLAAVYAKLGETEKAKNVIAKMTLLFPQLKAQGEEFLRNLELEK